MQENTYIDFQNKSDGLLFDFVNQNGYAFQSSYSTIAIIDLVSQTLKSTTLNMPNGTVYIQNYSGKFGWLNKYNGMQVYDDVHQRILLVTTGNSLQIVNQKSGFVEYLKSSTPISVSIQVDTTNGYQYIINDTKISLYSLNDSNLGYIQDVTQNGTIYQWDFDRVDGSLVVLETGNPQQKYDVSTNSLTDIGTYSPTQKIYSCFSYDPINNFYIYNYNNSLKKVDLSDNSNSTVTSLSSNNNILRYDKDNNLYYLSDNNIIYVLDGTTLQVNSTITVGSEIFYLDFDPYHNFIQQLEETKLNVIKYDTSTKQLSIHNTYYIDGSNYYYQKMDTVNSRIYQNENGNNRINVIDYQDKLVITKTLTRGQSEWNGTPFNDQLDINIQTVEGTNVNGQTLNLILYGNQVFYDNTNADEIGQTTSQTTNSDGNQTFYIRVKGQGKYVVQIEAIK